MVKQQIFDVQIYTVDSVDDGHEGRLTPFATFMLSNTDGFKLLNTLVLIVNFQ
jgi:hypothetical protein